MKKILFWVITFLFVLVLGFWIWCQRPGLSVEKVLPAHPLLFVRLLHVHGHVDQVIKSDFGKNIAAIDVPEVLGRNKFSPKDIADYKHWQKSVLQFWNNPFIQRLVGKETTVSLYRKNKSYQVYLTFRLTLSTRIAELLGQLSHQWGDGVTLTVSRGPTLGALGCACRCGGRRPPGCQCGRCRCG